MKCFYHSSDLDGICSAAIIKYKYPECELIPIDYNYDPGIFAGISVGEIVFIVDFNVEIERVKWLRKTACFIWIDHHKTAIEKCQGLGAIAGIREVGKAACELTWEYLFPGKTIPEAVRLLGRYDVWDHSDPNTLPWQYGMRQYNLTPDVIFWGVLFECGKLDSDILIIGKIILKYQNQQNEIFAKAAFEITLDGLRLIVLNRIYTNSQIFDSVYDPEKHDAMMTYGFDGKQWRYSMYSKNDIDVSEVAKKYGGGGHKNAAGFILNENVINVKKCIGEKG